MYLKIKFLRFTVLLVRATYFGDITPRWVRYINFYFRFITFPWTDYVTHRKEDRFFKAAKAFEMGHATDSDLMCIMRMSQYSAAVLHKPEDLQRKAFLAITTANDLSPQLSRFYMSRALWSDIAPGSDEEKLMRKCLRTVFDSLDKIHDLVSFYYKYEYNPAFEFLSKDFKLKFLSKVRKRFLVDDMVTYDQFLSLHVRTRDELSEIQQKVDERMSAIVQQELSKEECKKLFSRWDYLFITGPMADEALEILGYDTTNYQSYVFNEEREAFEKTYLTWNYLLYRKITTLVQQWSNEDFNESLPVKEYFRRFEEGKS